MDLRISRWGRLGLIAVGAVLVITCGSSKTSNDDKVVATVGDREIKFRQIKDYITSLNVDYKTAADEYAARHRYLDKLIDEELLIIGGYGRALDADIGLLEKVEIEKDKFLMDELYRTEVTDKIDISEDEVKEAYEHYFDRVRFRHILVEDSILADTVKRLLDAGEEFGDVAEEFSFDRQSRFRGGDMGRDFEWGEFPEPLNTELFKASEGDLVGPVKTEFGWHFALIMQKRRMKEESIETLHDFLMTRLHRRKEQQRRQEHLLEIKERAGIEYDPITLSAWRNKLKAQDGTAPLPAGQRHIVDVDSLSDEEASRTMYQFGSGLSVSFGQFCESLGRQSPYNQPDPDDTAALELFAFNNSLYDILREEAIKSKLDETQVYKDRVRRYHEQLIAEEMKNSILARGVSVTESDLHDFYEAHPDSFIQPSQYHIRELLVFDSTRIPEFEAQLAAGQSLAELARQFTERSGMKSNAGDLGWLGPNSYTDMYEKAEHMEIGEVRRAFAGGQYSLIQLLGHRPARQLDYDEVESALFARLQRVRTDSSVQAFIDSVRTQNPVVIHEEALRAGLGEIPKDDESVGS